MQCNDGDNTAASVPMRVSRKAKAALGVACSTGGPPLASPPDARRPFPCPSNPTATRTMTATPTPAHAHRWGYCSVSRSQHLQSLLGSQLPEGRINRYAHGVRRVSPRSDKVNMYPGACQSACCNLTLVYCNLALLPAVRPWHMTACTEPSTTPANASRPTIPARCASAAACAPVPRRPPAVPA